MREHLLNGNEFKNTSLWFRISRMQKELGSEIEIKRIQSQMKRLTFLKKGPG